MFIASIASSNNTGLCNAATVTYSARFASSSDISDSG